MARRNIRVEAERQSFYATRMGAQIQEFLTDTWCVMTGLGNGEHLPYIVATTQLREANCAIEVLRKIASNLDLTPTSRKYTMLRTNAPICTKHDESFELLREMNETKRRRKSRTSPDSGGRNKKQ